MDTKTLNKIRFFAIKEYGQSKDKQHSFGHAERVAKNALWITDILKVGDGFDKNLLQAACYLHDIVITKRNSRNYFSQFYSHIFEKLLNKKYIRQTLEYFDLPPEEEQILAVSIVNHPYSIPYRVLNKQRDLYSKVLQDADSLDSVSLRREHSFINRKGKILTYLTSIYLFWIRNNIEKYLNFPELTNKLNNGLISPEGRENRARKK